MKYEDFCWKLRGGQLASYCIWYDASHQLITYVCVQISQAISHEKTLSFSKCTNDWKRYNFSMFYFRMIENFIKRLLNDHRFVFVIKRHDAFSSAYQFSLLHFMISSPPFQVINWFILENVSQFIVKNFQNPTKFCKAYIIDFPCVRLARSRQPMERRGNTTYNGFFKIFYFILFFIDTQMVSNWWCIILSSSNFTDSPFHPLKSNELIKVPQHVFSYASCFIEYVPSFFPCSISTHNQ